MKFLLDTDACVFWLRGRESVRERLAVAGLDSIAISVLTLAELRYGADCSAKPVENHQALDNFISTIAVLGVDLETEGCSARSKHTYGNRVRLSKTSTF